METIILVLIITSQTSCFQHYFKTDTHTSVDEKMLMDQLSSNKTFIIHSNEKIMKAKSIQLNNSKISATLVPLAGNEIKYSGPNTTHANRYFPDDNPVLLNSVHLYTTARMDDSSHITILLSEITRMDLYKKDKGATNTSKAIGIVGIAAAVGATVGLIVALIDFPFL